MMLEISRNKTVGDLQREFSESYPFLRLDVYDNFSPEAKGRTSHRLNNLALLNPAKFVQSGMLEIRDSMSVGELEKSFYDLFRMVVQVSRKSGKIWLETTMTDKWTLKQQNDHGRELSEPGNKEFLEEFDSD